jgi:hypothetical protein
VILLINGAAVIRLTMPGFEPSGMVFGLAAFALWALVCLMAPALPTANGAAGLAVGLAALAAVQWTGRESSRRAAVAGFSAGSTVAFLSAAYIDGVLPYLGRWVANSAPPGPGYRLVDPIGLYVLSALISLAVLATLFRLPARRAAQA